MAYVKSDQVKQLVDNFEKYRLFREDKPKLFIRKEFDQCRFLTPKDHAGRRHLSDRLLSQRPLTVEERNNLVVYSRSFLPVWYRSGWSGLHRVLTNFWYLHDWFHFWFSLHVSKIEHSSETIKANNPLHSSSFLIYVNDMPNPSHHQTNKSQFADDAGQWAVSKNIDLAAEYLQRDLDKLARWCVKWRIKLNPDNTKVIIFSKSQIAIRAEPALSLYRDLLSYHPHIKFLGITFDNRMTFTKHFEEILEHCNQKFHRLRILVNKKWGPSPAPILQIYKQCVRPIFKYGIASTITVSETVITKIQRVHNSFIRLALRLPKYVSARLLYEASGLPYVREILITVGPNHLARMHANPLLEHTINSARTNIAWDKYKTPISILKPPD